MSDRGDYRSFFCAFWDDADVHALSDAAYRVLTTLKGTLNAAGIGVVYTSQLADRCGKSGAQIEAALVELETPKPGAVLGWIVRERNIVWIVNGLRFEPTLTFANRKHRTFVRERLLAPLGERTIVQAFRRHYPEWFEDAAPKPNLTNDDMSSNANTTAIDTVSKHSPVQSSPSLTSPIHSETADDTLTAAKLSTWVNAAIEERWGPQVDLKTPASAELLLRRIREQCIPADVVKASIYRQCRDSKSDKPFRTVHYFEPGIIEDRDRGISRTALARHDEPAPPREQNGRRDRRAKSAPDYAGAATDSEDKVKWQKR